MSEKKVYVRKRLLESQGVDEEIAEIVPALVRRITEDWSEVKKSYNLEDPLESTLATRKYDIRLHVPKALLTRETGEITDFWYNVVIYAGWYPEWGDQGGVCRFKTDNCRVSFEIVLNMVHETDRYGMKRIEEFLMHELMHTKNAIREMSEEGHSLTSILKSGMPGEPVGKNSENGDEFNPFMFLKYFLSPNEMKAYVAGEYKFMYENTRYRIERGEKADKEWFEEAFKKSASYRHMQKCSRYISEMDPEEGDRFLRENKFGAERLKKILGISSGEDFRRYFKKNLKNVGLKIVKAAYKGYRDAIEKHKGK